MFYIEHEEYFFFSSLFLYSFDMVEQFEASHIQNRIRNDMTNKYRKICVTKMYRVGCKFTVAIKRSEAQGTNKQHCLYAESNLLNLRRFAGCKWISFQLELYFYMAQNEYTEQISFAVRHK